MLDKKKKEGTMKKRPQFERILICLLIATCLVGPLNVSAHRPHDVVTEVELSPTYEIDQTLFIIVRENFFRTTDGGNYWTRVVNGLDCAHWISSLSISPENKDIVYLSTDGNGVYKSTDGGLSWNKKINGLLTKNISKLIVFDSDVLLASGAGKGLFRTTNGGQTWTTLDNNAKIANLASNIKETIRTDKEGEILISYDKGDTWDHISTIDKEVTALSISPKFYTDKIILIGTDSGILKIVYENGSAEVDEVLSNKKIMDIVFSPNYEQDKLIFVSTWYDGCFVSKDGGDSWTFLNNGLTKEPQADEMASPHFSDLEIVDTCNLTLYLAGFDGLFKSENSGQNWKQIETLSEGTVLGMAISPNYKNDSTVAVINYVGEAYISYDSGANWAVMREGLESIHFLSFEDEDQDDRRFYDIAFSPDYEQDNTIFASVLYGRIVKSTDKGRNWKIISLPTSDRGPTIAVSPNYATDKTVFIGAQYGNIYKSEDAGESFSKISYLGRRRGNHPLSLIISNDYKQDKTLFATGPLGIYKSTNGGTDWTATTNGTELTEAAEIKLTISPNYELDKTIIAGTQQGLFKTEDEGESWYKVPITDNDNIEGVAFSPNYENDGIFLVSIRGKGLFKTTNKGADFEHIGNDSISLSRTIGPPSAPMPIQFSPNFEKDNTIFGFGSAETEIFKSTDKGNTWAIIKIPREKIDDYGFIAAFKLQLFVWKVQSAMFFKQNKSKVIFVFALIGLIAILVLILIARKLLKK
jgi:photosystem II stability/assembly factor-like uncharacterized protein